MKQTLILCGPEPLYICKRHADCRGARKKGYCNEECFYTLDKSLAIDSNAFYVCMKPSGEGGFMLIREDKLKLFNLIERRKE